MCWGYIGIMENKMETTRIIGGYIRVIWGLYGYWGCIGIIENKIGTTCFRVWGLGVLLG